jgi:putative transposase
MRKTFQYRLYPTREQRRLLDQQVEACRWLDNRLLEARKTAWEQRQEAVRLYDQHALLPALKAERPTLARGQSPVVPNGAVRMDLAFQAFFRRLKAGEAEPGSPRLRGVGRDDRCPFPQGPVGWHLEAGAKRVRVMNVGRIKLVLHRALEGTPRTATIQRSSTGTWYLSGSCAGAEPVPLPPTGQQVGLEVGLEVGLAKTARPTHGEPIARPRCCRRDERALRGAQGRLAKVEKGERRSGPPGATWWPASTSASPGSGATSPTSTAAGWSMPLICSPSKTWRSIGGCSTTVSPRASRMWRGLSAQRVSPTRQHGPVGSMSR